jgi:hypothetical protein
VLLQNLVIGEQVTNHIIPSLHGYDSHRFIWPIAMQCPSTALPFELKRYILKNVYDAPPASTSGGALHEALLTKDF